MASPLLPTLVALAADNPLPLAYLLYFSPYIATAVAYLLPLILTTALLLGATIVAPSVASTAPFSSDQDERAHIDASETHGYHSHAYSALLEAISCHLHACVHFDPEPYAYPPYDADDHNLQQQHKQFDDDDAAHAPKQAPHLSQPQCGRPPLPIHANTRTTGVITSQQFQAIAKLYKALTQGMDAHRCLPVSPLLTQTNAADDNTRLQMPRVPSDHDQRHHSRASPLQGWETPAASHLHFFGGSLREGHCRNDPTTVLSPCKSMSNVHDRRWARCVIHEGMDMLWEEYDQDNGKTETQPKPKKDDNIINNNNNNNNNNNKWGHCHHNTINNNRFLIMGRSRSRVQRGENVVNEKMLCNQDEQQAYADADDSQVAAAGTKLCCLQALRFSTGRMRFGMPKIATAFARTIKGTTLAAFRHHAASSPARTTPPASRKRP